MDERMSVFTRFFILAILSIFVIIIKKKNSEEQFLMV